MHSLTRACCSIQSCGAHAMLRSACNTARAAAVLVQVYLTGWCLPRWQARCQGVRLDACLGSSLLQVGQEMPQVHEGVHCLETGRQCWEGELAGGCKLHQLCTCSQETYLSTCAAGNLVDEFCVRLLCSSRIALQKQEVQ